MIKVMVIDDQVLLRESIGYILDNDDDIKVLSMYGEAEKAIEQCAKTMPDLILMDIEMPSMNGVIATQKIKEKYPLIKVIMLTTFENPDNIMKSFMVGADGYIVKNINHQDLVLTVKCVAQGLTVIHESVKRIMVKRFSGLSEYQFKYKDKLTEKEIEIIKLIGMGKSNKEIAVVQNYSEGTIKNHVSKIFEKLELIDRMQVAIFAIENGIV